MSDSTNRYIPNTTGSRILDVVHDGDGRGTTSTRAIIGWRVGSSGRPIPVTLTEKPADSDSVIVTDGADPVLDAGNCLATIPMEEISKWADALHTKRERQADPFNRSKTHGALVAFGKFVGRDGARALMKKFAPTFDEVMDGDIAELSAEIRAAFDAALADADADDY